jgi:hypothetical protein
MAADKGKKTNVRKALAIGFATRRWAETIDTLERLAEA